MIEMHTFLFKLTKFYELKVTFSSDSPGYIMTKEGTVMKKLGCGLEKYVVSRHSNDHGL